MREKFGLVRRVERRRAIVRTLDERHAGRRLEDRVALLAEGPGGQSARNIDGKRLRLDLARERRELPEARQRRLDVTCA